MPLFPSPQPSGRVSELPVRESRECQIPVSLVLVVVMVLVVGRAGPYTI